MAANQIEGTTFEQGLLSNVWWQRKANVVKIWETSFSPKIFINEFKMVLLLRKWV